MTKMQAIPVNAAAVLMPTMPPVGPVAGDSPVLGRHAQRIDGSAFADATLGVRPRGVPV